MLTCVVLVLAVAPCNGFCLNKFTCGTLLVTAFASTNAYLCSSSFSGGTLLVTAFASTNAYLCSSGFSGGTLLVTDFCLNKCLPV